MWEGAGYFDAFSCIYVDHIIAADDYITATSIDSQKTCHFDEQVHRNC